MSWARTPKARRAAVRAWLPPSAMGSRDLSTVPGELVVLVEAAEALDDLAAKLPSEYDSFFQGLPSRSGVLAAASSLWTELYRALRRSGRLEDTGE